MSFTYFNLGAYAPDLFVYSNPAKRKRNVYNMGFESTLSAMHYYSDGYRVTPAKSMSRMPRVHIHPTDVDCPLVHEDKFVMITVGLLMNQLIGNSYKALIA